MLRAIPGSGKALILLVGNLAWLKGATEFCPSLVDIKPVIGTGVLR